MYCNAQVLAEERALQTQAKNTTLTCTLTVTEGVCLDKLVQVHRTSTETVKYS